MREGQRKHTLSRDGERERKERRVIRAYSHGLPLILFILQTNRCSSVHSFVEPDRASMLALLRV